MRSGTVPVDARLLKDSGPVCDGSEIRDDWQIQINSETHDYVASLKTKLSDYHVVSESGSSTTFVRTLDGDSYTVEIKTFGTVVDVAFLARPD